MCPAERPGRPPVRVIGYLGRPDERLRREVAEADLVVGGRRHLDALEVPEERRVVLGRVSRAVEVLKEASSSTAVVLASGDPGWFGIVRSLRQHGLAVVAEPQPSAVAVAFARLGLPWEDAVVVSAHGRDPRAALALARTCRSLAVLTSAGHGLRELAAAVADLDRWLVLAEGLGEPDERLRVLTPAQALLVEDIAQPNVVLVLSDHPGQPVRAEESVTIAHQPPALDTTRCSAEAAVLAAGLGARPGMSLWCSPGLVDQLTCLCPGVAVLDVSSAEHWACVGLGPDLAALLAPDPDLLALVGGQRPLRIALLDATERPAGYRWSPVPGLSDHTLTIGAAQ